MSTSMQINSHHSIRITDHSDGTCAIVARSPFTGKMNEIIVNQREDYLAAQIRKWLRQGGLVQEILHMLSDEEREFIMTGYTGADWNEAFAPADE